MITKGGYVVIMIRTQISLDPELYRDARERARREGISFAELVRRALSRILDPELGERPWMRLAGAIEDAGPDASQSVDAVVYDRDRP